MVEGIGDFTGEWLPRLWVSQYQMPRGPIGSYSYENNLTCRELPGGPAVDDPQLTEGIFAALLLDLVDGQQDNDLAFTSLSQDATQFDLKSSWMWPRAPSRATPRTSSRISPH